MSEIHLALLEDLQTLGRTPEEMARKLRGLGLKGVRKCYYGCPVAGFLRRLGYGVLEVGCLEIVIVGRIRVKTPDLVREFIRMFDENRWPDLVLA